MRHTERNNETGDPKIREALESIEMPQDSENRVLERVNAAVRGEHMEAVLRKKPFPVRKAVLIAAAVLLLAAVTAGLFVALRPNVPEPTPDPSGATPGAESGTGNKTESRPGNGGGTKDASGDVSDWVAELFDGSEEPENVEGTVKEVPPSETSYAFEAPEEPAPAPSDGKPGKSYSEKGDDRGATGDDPLPDGPRGEDPALPAWAEPDGPADFDGLETGTDVPSGFVGPTGQVSSGTLTAGSRDDNRFFGEFLEKMDSMKSFGPLWRMYPTRRMTVRVSGVNNAMVAMSDEQGNVISYARTDASGCAYLYYDLYSETTVSRPAKIGVSNGSSFTEVVLTGNEGDVVEVECGEPVSQEKIDVLIMLDTTGSMGDELTYLQAELEDVIARVKKEAGNAKVRLSVNFYRDHGDDYVVSYNPFTENVRDCVDLLMKERANGGGDWPEAVDEALVNATVNHAWDPDAVKVMFLILDAPPHQEYDRQGTLDNLRKAVDSARKQGIRIIPVVASGIDDSTEYLMRSVAAATGGTYVFLTGHSGVGGDHKDPNIDQYDVEKLNDLMVRLILSYWGVGTQDPVSGGTETSGGNLSEETFYSITVEGSAASAVKSAHASAPAGETVELRTDVTTDVSVAIAVDGKPVEAEIDGWEYVYAFVMPDHDVTVTASFETWKTDGQKSAE